MSLLCVSFSVFFTSYIFPRKFLFQLVLYQIFSQKFFKFLKETTFKTMGIVSKQNCFYIINSLPFYKFLIIFI